MGARVLINGTWYRGDGAENRQRLVDRRIIDVAVRHEPQRFAAPGAGPQARLSSAEIQVFASAPLWPTSSMTMLVSTSRGSETWIDGVQALGDPLRAPVIIGQPIDHALERDEAGRGHDAGLAHAAADHAAIGPRALDEGRRSAQHRAERRAQALADAEADAVAMARDLARPARRARPRH